MPCDTIARSTVNLELRADNAEYLKAALKSLGYNVSEMAGKIYFSSSNGLTGDFNSGKLTITGNKNLTEKFDINTVKRAYSVQVVQAAGKKFGWQIKPIAENKYAVQKRGF